MQVSVLWVRFDCSATTGAAGVVTGISKFVCGRAWEVTPPREVALRRVCTAGEMGGGAFWF